MTSEELRLDTITVSEMSDADIQALYVGILGGRSRNPANDCDKIFRALARRNATVEEVLKVREAGLRNAAGVFSIGDGLVQLGKVGALKQDENSDTALVVRNPGMIAKVVKAVRDTFGNIPSPIINSELAAKFEEHRRGIRFIYSGLHVAESFEPLSWPQEPSVNAPVEEQIRFREYLAAECINHAVGQLLEAGLDETIFEKEVLVLSRNAAGEEERIERYKLAQKYLDNPQLLFRELKERCNQGGFFQPIDEKQLVPVQEIVSQITEAQRDIENKVGEPGFNQLKVEKLRDDLAQMYAPTVGAYAILKKKTPEEGQTQNPAQETSDKNEPKP